MNKKAFMLDLQCRLKRIPKEDYDDAMAYYEEYFEEMGADDTMDVTASVGQPGDVAREIISNCTDRRLVVQKQKGGVKNSAMVVWMIVLGVFASPIAIPVAIVALVLLFTGLVVVASLGFAFVCTGAGMLVGGVGALISVFWAAGFAERLICLGIGLIGISIGMLVVIATIKLVELLIRVMVRTFRRIFMRKKGNHE